jgi:hypothetical protein
MQLHGVILNEDPPGYVLLGDFIGFELGGMQIEDAYHALRGTNGYPEWVGQGIRYIGSDHYHCRVLGEDIEFFVQRIRSYYPTKVYPWEYLEPQNRKNNQ